MILTDRYPMMIRPLSAKEGSGYEVSFPDLPGCTSAGATIADAIERAADAKADWFAMAEKAGFQCPPPNSHFCFCWYWLEAEAFMRLCFGFIASKHGKNTARKIWTEFVACPKRGRPAGWTPFEDETVLGLLRVEADKRQTEDATAIATRFLATMRCGANALGEKPSNYGPNERQTIERWARHIRDYRLGKGRLFVAQPDVIKSELKVDDRGG